MSSGDPTSSTPIQSVCTTEPVDDRRSAVRFETQCVVIPDHAHRSRRPRVVTKSYTLPAPWKKRTSSASFAPPEVDSAEENQSHLILRVPLPTFSRKTHSTTRSVDHTPLPSCLVHRAQPSGSSCGNAPSDSPPRYPRTPRRPSLSPSRPDIVTIPLRPCCAACQSVTDAAVVGGDAWPVRFSHAASRRRSASADGSPRTITVAGSSASVSYGTLGVSISVDEIDKRRRSSDKETQFNNAEAKKECRVPFTLRRAAASSSSCIDARPPSSPATPRIPEEEDDEDEDENELFPLPSPKRTPSTSPAPSPAGSLSSLMVAQSNQCSATSPTHSTCSDPHLNKRQFLAPPPCASSSSLSLPKFSESMPDLTLVEDPPRVPSPSLLSMLPPLSDRHCSRSPSPRISLVPCTPPDTLPCSMDSTPESLDFVLVPNLVPSSPTSSQPSTSPHSSPTHTRFPWRSKRSVSAGISSPPSCSPSSSPTLSATSSSSNTKKAFSISSPRHVISDVLRGVGSIGSSGIGIGI